MNKDAVLDLFEVLEFRRLAERWFGKDLPNPIGSVVKSSAKVKPFNSGQIDLFVAEENDGQKSFFDSSYKTIETTKVNYN